MNTRCANRDALTLVELLVVVVILITLVAGVLPLVSPNNDARKIREAGRGLQTYLMQAQAEAARTGRPVGVGFVESAPGSGVALEAFQLTVPAPYAGASQHSRVRILQPQAKVSGETYGIRDNQNPYGNGGVAYNGFYKGYQLYHVQFILLPHPPVFDQSRPINAEDFPDNLLRIGDIIDIEGNEFLIIDDVNNEVNSRTGYLNSGNEVVCVWTNEYGQSPQKYAALQPTNSQDRGATRHYQVIRQPLGYNPNRQQIITSMAAPYQFPTGIALDLQATGIEPIASVMETVANQQDITIRNNTSPSVLSNSNHLKQFGLMFSPEGGIESVWMNSDRRRDAAKIFMLLGRVENGNPDYTNTNQNNWTNLSDAELADQRQQVNWLNLDSRWIMINGTSGKFTVEESSGTDPRNEMVYADMMNDFNPDIMAARGGQAEMIKLSQIESAHGLAHGRNVAYAITQ